jgi:hypothetical protein
MKRLLATGWSADIHQMRDARTYEQLASDYISADQSGAVGSDRDLAENRPGQAARQRALEAAAAHPAKAFWGRLLSVHTDERAWRLGADGEELVGRILHRLVAKRDPRWRVIHSVPVGTRGSDFDHVVIGPGGVFTLNAKHHPRARIWVRGDTLLVNGARKPYVRNSRHEAERAARLLAAACGFRVEVTGVVVPVNASDIVVKQAPAGVHVVNRRRLGRWLRTRAHVLDAVTIDVIYGAARRPSTWR